jgi:UDP-N-acetylglucosamine 1-carboxyvinyltransferase
VKELRGTRHSLIPDDTEAGTYLLAGVATGGDITVKDVISKHLEPLLAKIAEMGAFIEDREDAVRVIARGRPKSVNAITRPYPGFPTDLQQPLIAVMATAENVSLIQESMYDNRFGFINELVKMGANVRVDGRTAIVEGVDHLMGSPVTAHDLRAGAALLVAALSARGVTEIYGIEHLDRGYERIEEKVSGLGGCIARVC